LAVATDPRIHVSLRHLQSLQAAARNLNFLPRQPSASVLNGRHASRLRGRGLNFEEMRDYLPGDDIRSIDWKATARTGTPHVRVFTEERDRPALLVVDQRMSMFFGSVLNMKSVTAAEVAAIAAFRILDVGDRVGGIVFDDDRQVEFVPKRSRRMSHALLETIAEFNTGLNADRPANASAGSLNTVLQSVSRIAHHDHLVFVLSDFDGIDDSTHRHLSNIARHNDLILGLIYDPSARAVASGPRAILGDGEMQVEVDFNDDELVGAVNRFSARRLERIMRWQAEINLSVLPLSAGVETLPQLQKLMGTMAPTRRVR
jgi:uncharacterized protein (DUF58 family)